MDLDIPIDLGSKFTASTHSLATMNECISVGGGRKSGGRERCLSEGQSREGFEGIQHIRDLSGKEG